MKQNYAALKHKIRASLDISWKEGIPAAAMLAVMEYYLIPYGLFLGMSSQDVGLLVALPQLLASIAQLFAVRAVGLARSRVGFLVRASSYQSILLALAAALALLPISGKMLVLIFLAVLVKVLGDWIGVAWGSLVSDYLPAETRGRYLGWRSQVVGIAGLAGMGLGGTLLFFTKETAPALGFFILFLCASAFRLASSYLMSKMADLPARSTPESEFSFWMFLGRMKESNFVKFVFYAASIAFGANVAGPYFSVFMLRELRFDYLTYTFLHLASAVAGLISYPIWGRHADLAGNAKILKFTGFFLPVLPVLWLVSQNLVYLVWVQILGGFLWGGFILCGTNFIYDAVSPEKRVRCLGYFNLINGAAIFAGASLGGFLADRLPAILGFRLFSLFALSGTLRLIFYVLLSGRFREVREPVRPVSGFRLFASVTGLRPLPGEK